MTIVLRSVTSIMSTTGDPAVGQATPESMGALLTPPPEGRDAVLALGMTVARVIAGPLFDEEEGKVRVAASYDRSFYPAGALFQMAAIAATGDRTERLAGVDLPFLVIHGEADELISVTGGQATAAAVPKADLLVLSQMGHDVPAPYWDQTVSAIKGIANRPF